MVPSRASPATQPVSPQQLVRDFPQLAKIPVLLVAFSGGLDSTVLLHLLATARNAGLLQGELKAIHINHGLQAVADDWQLHCEYVCNALNIPLASVRLRLQDIQGTAGKPVSEARARTARYASFAAALPAGSLLLQAHHQQDQVETLLFRLIRGTGLKGLAGIPVERALGLGKICRPLLNEPRHSLQAYARQHDLSWVEDPSNFQSDYSRNFLRQHILPGLYQRWPGLGSQMALTASHCDESARLLEELAKDDLEQLCTKNLNCLSIEGLLQLTGLRRNNVLRYWYHLSVGGKAPPLNHKQLLALQDEVLDASADAAPLLVWGAGESQRELRRYRKFLYLNSVMPQPPESVQWNPAETLVLPTPLGCLSLDCAATSEAMVFETDKPLEVRFRQGGEMVKLPGRPTRPLKQLFQELAVPPWLRDLIPLVYQEGKLLAVADWYRTETDLTPVHDGGMKVVWKHPDLHCGR